MSNTNRANPPSSAYEDIAITREACEAIIECNPHHIRFLPTRFINGRLAARAVRLGATQDDIPSLPY